LKRCLRWFQRRNGLRISTDYDGLLHTSDPRKLRLGGQNDDMIHQRPTLARYQGMASAARLAKVAKEHIVGRDSVIRMDGNREAARAEPSRSGHDTHMILDCNVAFARSTWGKAPLMQARDTQTAASPSRFVRCVAISAIDTPLNEN
jgi:hypothetical protein